MIKVLKKWFEWSYEPTAEAAEWYKKVHNCIEQIEAGETTIDGRQAEATLIWYTVNFINALDKMLENETRRPILEDHVNLIFVVIRRMSFLTYREIFDLFPVRTAFVDQERYFDGKDIYFDEDKSNLWSPSLDTLGIISLCGCGIHFGDETEGTTDFDSEIGDGIMKYVTNNYHPVLRKFYSTFLYAIYSVSYSYGEEQDSY